MKYESQKIAYAYFLATAGPGLEAVLLWAVRHRQGWRLDRAWPAFAGSLIAVALLVTAFALWRSGVLNGEWNRRQQGYDEIGHWLAARGEKEAPVMVGDAPAFAWHTGLPAVAIPNEPPTTIVAVARKYGARYLVLDAARPRTTDALYSGQASYPGIDLLYEVEQWQLYTIQP